VGAAVQSVMLVLLVNIRCMRGVIVQTLQPYPWYTRIDVKSSLILQREKSRYREVSVAQRMK